MPRNTGFDGLVARTQAKESRRRTAESELTVGPEKMTREEEKQLDRIVDGLIESWMDEKYGLPNPDDIEEVA